MLGLLGENKKPLFSSAYSYGVLRSLLYTAEGLLGPAIDLAVNRHRPRLPIDDPQLFRAARIALDEILRQDARNIAEGLYPVEVLMPENPLRHLRRLSPMLREGIRIARRRKTKEAHQFSEQANDLLRDMPDYYRRNFHFQGDGYLSGESADLYEHQVEILFAGAADAMRRLIIPPMKKHFANSDGDGLTFLELAAGTGRATRFVRLAFPKAKIVAVDLSAPYLKKAQEQLKAYARHDFVEANASSLPFLPETFDAVFSVFLFHELPFAERQAVIKEGLRVLRSGGFYGFVDSLQMGDRPEFDLALEQFPKEFHEPFYRNYAQHPMESLLTEAGLQSVQTGTGFFSKVVSALKPAL